MTKISLLVEGGIRTLLAATGVCLWAISAPAMPPEEAGRLLGEEEPRVAQQAEEALLAAGKDALGVLTELSFSKNKRVAERARLCRRRILYGIPSGLPPELENGILKFHQQDAETRQQLIERIRKHSKLGARSLAHLFSQLHERDRQDSSLNDISSALSDMQSNSTTRVPLTGFDPLLLDVRARALVVDSLTLAGERSADQATYRKWVALDPSIRDWYTNKGIEWEAERLSSGQSVEQVLAALAEVENERLRQKIAAFLFPWANETIQGWQKCPAGLRVSALDMAYAKDPGKAQKIYQEFLGSDPELAKQLPAGLLALEVRRLLSADQITEACRVATLATASLDLMRMIGEEARLRPEAFVEGFPDPADMTKPQRKGFLDGLAQPCHQDHQDEWWEWVGKVRVLSARGATAGVWQETMMQEKMYGYLLPLTASQQDLQGVIDQAAQDGMHKTPLVLAALMRKEPALIQQVKAGEKNVKLLQAALETLLGMSAGLEDIRVVKQMLATWSLSRPDLQPDELTGIYQPLDAIKSWDTGDRHGCVRRLKETSNQESAVRVMIELLITVPLDSAVDLARSIQLPNLTVRAWVDVATTLDDIGLAKVCDLLDRLDEEGAELDQMLPIDPSKLKRYLWPWFQDGRQQRVDRLVDTCYWFLEPAGWLNVCAFAEMMRMAHGEEWVQSASESARALRKPLHRVVLLRAINRDDQVSALVDTLANDEFKERVLMEQGRYVEAVSASTKRKKEPYNELRMNDARVFEPDSRGKHAEAKDIMWQQRSGRVQPWLQWLVGVGVESLAVTALNGFDGRRVVEHGAMEPVMLNALESRALAAARGDALIDESTLLHYTSLAPWLPDRRRTLEVLRRWAEIPPERMPDIIKHMDFYCSLRVYRALLACGQIELARARLLDLVRYKGGVDGLNQPEVENLCGWEMGPKWKESLAWRLMRREHPDLEDIDLLQQLALSSQMVSMETGMDRLGELLTKHAAAFSHDEQRRIILAWSDGTMKPMLDPQGNLQQWLGQVRLAMANPSPFHFRPIEMEYRMGGKPDELVNKSTRSDRRPLAAGITAVADAWRAERQDEARALLRRLILTLILDVDLERSISHDYRLVRNNRSYGVGTSYSPAEHVVWQAHLHGLTAELLHEEVSALCRMMFKLSGEALERVGMDEQALRQHRLDAARHLGEPWISLADRDIDRAATLRRLECKLAMQCGDPRELLAAVRRFLPMDPYHRAFLLEVRDWFTARDDAASAAEVDDMVVGFWKDRLMWLPGFRRYQLELSQWLLAVEQRRAR